MTKVKKEDLIAQIKLYREENQERLDRIEEITAVTVKEARAAVQSEEEEEKTLETEMAIAEKQIKRLEKQLARTNAELAAESVAAEEKDAEVTERSAPRILTLGRTSEDKFKGQTFAQAARLKALRFKHGADAAAYAKDIWGAQRASHVEKALHQIMRKDVAGGTTTGTGGGAWGGQLVTVSDFGGDFIELLRPDSLYDKLAFRPVPHNVLIKGQDGTGGAYHIGEGDPIQVSKSDFVDVELKRVKVAGVQYVTSELLEDSDPAVDQLIIDGMRADIVEAINTNLVSNAAVAEGVRPAGLLNGLSTSGPTQNQFTASGTAGADAESDAQDLVNYFVTRYNAQGLTWVFNPGMKLRLSRLRTFSGQFLFPELSSNQWVGGYPVVTSDHVAFGTIMLVKASDIYRIGDEGGVSIDVQAAVTLDVRDDITASTAVNRNLWQRDEVAIRAIRKYNYAKRRTSAVAAIVSADYQQESFTD